MILKHKLQNVLALLVIACSGIVFAAPEEAAVPAVTGAAPAVASKAVTDPIVLLKNVTSNILAALKQNHVDKDTKPGQLFAVVDRHILPYVDFNEMSTWVAGRKIWAKASQQTRDNFVAQFKVLVVRTYATALRSYSNEVIDFPSQKIDTSKGRVQVSSWIKRGDREKIRMDYRMIKHGDSWLVYDVIIEGVSILQGFQAQFSDKIRQNGLESVVAEIKQHNEKKAG